VQKNPLKKKPPKTKGSPLKREFQKKKVQTKGSKQRVQKQISQ
ncbi:hypothetical protein HMPREF1434_00001, partial [Helicobacter pylori GAMchJs124i]